MEYQVPLENRVINAFIRRKQGFLVKVMQGDDYQRVAHTAMLNIEQVAQGYHSVGSNPNIKGMVKALKKMLENSFSGDVERHAMQYAHTAYISPHEHKEEHEHLLAGVVADDKGLKKQEQAYQKSYDAVCRNYYPIAALLAIGSVKGADFVTSEKAIATAVETAFPSRQEFIAKENELVEALSAYAQARLSLNDVDGDQDAFYVSAMAIIANNVGVAACKMAAEIEADEVYGK
ncbi:MAG: hypothetical protein KJ955_04575 [Nanoarchaeota archaeon]|nr:hypothetical protein [Nanoarchaeota archaeon]